MDGSYPGKWELPGGAIQKKHLEIGDERAIGNALKERVFEEIGIDIEIQFTGLRPGEKLYEELYYNNEKMISTENEKIFMLDNSNNNDFLVLIETFLNEGMGKFFDLNHREIRKAISDVVPEFNYSVVESDYTINRFVS